MRAFRIAVAALAALGCLLAGQSVASAAPSPSYYLALGDSLSQGYMPGAGDTNQGYVDDLYATLHAQHPQLRLVKLGCSGETTTTMRSGGICSYAEGSQVAAAEQFLRSHPGRVKYVTLDIGANDVDGCASTGTIDESCVSTGLRTIGQNLPVILTGLRQAGGFAPHLAGMTYYDPFLAAWLTGTAGQTTARESVVVTDMLNLLEGIDYSLAGARVVDVATAFRTSDFQDTATLPGVGTVPVNVATICTLTYMCTARNIHPNATGYQRIAAAFAAVLPGTGRVTGQ